MSQSNERRRHWLKARSNFWLSRPQDHFDAFILFVPEHLVGLRRFRKREPVRDHKAWIDRPTLDQFEKRPQITLDMSLPRTDRQCLVDDGPDRELVDEPAINTGNGNRATGPAREDRL